MILKVNDLSKVFNSPKGSTAALNRINFETHRREFLCVVGPSGCGKSTLVRILAGLEQHSSGEVLLDGKPVSEPGSDRGMVFQGYTLFPWLTVKKNVMFGLEINGNGSLRGRAAGDAMAAARRPGKICRMPSAPIVRRHEAARGDCSRARQPAAHPADGRAIWRARRADALRGCRRT